MDCAYCGTPLPSGALFCGECGRAVTVRATPPPTAVHDTVRITPLDLRDRVVAPPDPAPAAEPRAERVLDLDLPAWSSPDSASTAAQTSPRPRPETPAADAVGTRESSVGTPDAPPAGAVPPPPVTRAPLPPPPVPQPAAPAPAAPAAPAVEHERAPVAPPLGLRPTPRPSAGPAPVAPSPLVPPPAPGTPAPAAPPVESFDDVEATRLVSHRPAGARFVLQFSTGESVTVFGAGLLGRNPVPQPGEFFDHLVPLLDPGKSVSKTHLEFGQEGGAFWVLDRFSGNGTVVREPDAAPRRCEPGRRYVVARGARVDIGEQFFVVS